MFNVLENACQTSLVSSIFIDSLVWDEILTFFVDGIISQVHTEIVEITTKRRNVFLGCKSSEAFFVQEYSKWNHRCDQDIDTQVKF